MDPRLSKVIQYEDVTSLRALLAKDPLILDKAVVGPTAETPLHWAVLTGNGELVQEIVSRKPNFARELNHDGLTPLHIVSATGNLEVARELLTVGPDLCMIKDNGGRTPLHYAAIKGRVKVIEELLSQCPQALKERTAHGDTALHLAVKNSQFDGVKKLVEKVSEDGDADDLVTAKDDDGNTISQLAVASKQLQILNFLKKQNMVGMDMIDIVSGDQPNEQTNAKSQAKQNKKAATKADLTQQSCQSTDDDSSSNIWSEVEEMVLVVGSLIAIITYQAGLSPPETIWSDNMKLDKQCTSNHSFFSSTNLCAMAAYYLFMSFNTSGFFSSIFLIFFFRKPSHVQVLLPMALLSMVVTYMTVSVTLSPNGLSLLLIYVITLSISLYCMLAVEVVRTIFRNAFSFAAGKLSDVTKVMKNHWSLSLSLSHSLVVNCWSFEAQPPAKAQVVAQKDKKIAKEAVDRALANKRTVTEVTAANKEKALDKPVPDPVVVISSTKEENGKFAVRRVPKEAVDRALANRRTVTEVTAATKETALDKPVPDSVVVISSSEEEKPEVAIGNVLKEGSSKKKSLTPVLMARSKAACGLANKPEDCSVDIDEADANDELATVDDELAMVEYINDIYQFYKLTEDDGRVRDYMDSQLEINFKMRKILMDWLIEVHHKFKLMPKTLYLTVNIVDRYLSMKVVRKRELQLVGISAMLIASKYEEIRVPKVNDFVFISDNAYVKEQVLVMEKSILDKLEWYLTVPTPYVFLIRYIKASIPSNKEMENMMLFLAELGLMHYSTIILYCPSVIAASAVYAARCTLGKRPFWTETLEHHTGYSADQLMECAKLLVGLHSRAAESKLKAAYRKFSSPERGGVALLTPAKSLSAEEP